MKLKEKLTSRKFWAAVAGFVAGLAVVFGLDESIITQVAGLVGSIASVIAFIAAEGKIDEAGAEAKVDKTEGK